VGFTLVLHYFQKPNDTSALSLEPLVLFVERLGLISLRTGGNTSGRPLVIRLLLDLDEVGTLKGFCPVKFKELWKQMDRCRNFVRGGVGLSTYLP
jgi:hypothetical protein